jgi:hypothetical protein
MPANGLHSIVRLTRISEIKHHVQTTSTMFKQEAMILIEFDRDRGPEAWE